MTPNSSVNQTACRFAPAFSLHWPITSDVRGLSVNVTEVVPINRFDNLSFSSEIVEGKTSPLHTRYMCPRCAETIAFTKSHFEEHTGRQHTNLPTAAVSDTKEWEENAALSTRHFLIGFVRAAS